MANGFLSSPAGLHGQDLGGGTVALRWTYAEDIVAQGIVFDVFAATDPTDPFRSRVVADLNALTRTIAGFESGGLFYFIVVAKRAPLLSLPSRALAIRVEPVLRPVDFSPATTAGAAQAGLAFPFGIDVLGSISAEGGSALLRGKILQLLLTSPGERVNLPDYGTRLRDLVFDPNADVLAATTEFMIQRALQKYMADEIRVEQVAISVNDNVLQVNIVYLRKSDLQFERVRVGVPLPG
jgi:phage baseplate assembly protein W